MKSKYESNPRKMPSAAIGVIVAVVVLAFVAGAVWLNGRPSLPAVTGAPVIDTIDPESAQTTPMGEPDPNAPDAFIEQSGQFVTPEDTDDETVVVDTELPSDE